MTATVLNSTAYRMEADAARREAESRPASAKPASFTLATETDIVTFSPRRASVLVHRSNRDHAGRSSYSREMLSTEAARAEYRRLIRAGYRPW